MPTPFCKNGDVAIDAAGNIVQTGISFKVQTVLSVRVQPKLSIMVQTGGHSIKKLDMLQHPLGWGVYLKKKARDWLGFKRPKKTKQKIIFQHLSGDRQGGWILVAPFYIPLKTTIFPLNLALNAATRTKVGNSCFIQCLYGPAWLSPMSLQYTVWHPASDFSPSTSLVCSA